MKTFPLPFPFQFTSLLNLFIIILFISTFTTPTRSSLLSEPAQPLRPPDDSPPNTVPSFPVQTESELCKLDLSAELFGGVNAACGRNLDRSRCCPVLAAWLFAAHARSALQLNTSSSYSSGSGPGSGSGSGLDYNNDMPMMPDDSQTCVNSLQSSLLSRNIRIPQPNNTCDAVLCFCGIRLHQLGSLSCPAAFNIVNVTNTSRVATPTNAVRNLEKSCRNSTYAGCTKCLGALQKLNDDGQNGTRKSHHEVENRASKIMKRDCQLMGLTWLLARNKTAYIPTVSAVLRAIMYSAHPPHEFKCSPDQENMPLAVDSLQFDKSAASSSLPRVAIFVITLLPLVIYFV